jgi:hypothetical protein
VLAEKILARVNSHYFSRLFLVSYNAILSAGCPTLVIMTSPTSIILTLCMLPILGSQANEEVHLKFEDIMFRIYRLAPSKETLRLMWKVPDGSPYHNLIGM